MFVLWLKQILFVNLVVVDFPLVVFEAASDNNGDGVDDDDYCYFCRSCCLSEISVILRKRFHCLNDVNETKIPSRVHNTLTFANEINANEVCCDKEYY